MSITVQTDFPKNELVQLVKRVHELVETGDKHPKSSEERQMEWQMLRQGVQGHTKGKLPSERELGVLYGKGGTIVLQPSNGGSVDYYI